MTKGDVDMLNASGDSNYEISMTNEAVGSMGQTNIELCTQALYVVFTYQIVNCSQFWHNAAKGPPRVYSWS